MEREFSITILGKYDPARVLESLKEIEIDGLSLGKGYHRVSVLRFTCTNPEKARDVLNAQPYSFREKNVISIEPKNILEVLRIINTNDITVEYCYGSNRTRKYILSVIHPKKVEELLAQHGYTI